MVNPLGHWLWVMFCTSSRFPKRGLSGSQGIGFWVPLRRLSAFRVPPGLVVPAVGGISRSGDGDVNINSNIESDGKRVLDTGYLITNRINYGRKSGREKKVVNKE